MTRSFFSRLRRGRASSPIERLPIPDGQARDVTDVLEPETSGHGHGQEGHRVLLPPEDASAATVHGVLELQHLGPTTLRPGDAGLAEAEDLHRVAELVVVLDGEVEHRDALGNRGALRAPAARLLSSGAGLHAELGLHRDLVRDGGRVEVLTLRWAQDRPVTPTVRLADTLPERSQGRARIWPVVGADAALPSADGVTVTLADVADGGGLDLPIPADHRALLTVLRGQVLVGDTGRGADALVDVTTGRTALLDGEGTRCAAATRLDGGGARVVLVTTPRGMGDDVRRQGLLVHDDVDELGTILERLREGAFGQLPRS